MCNTYNEIVRMKKNYLDNFKDVKIKGVLSNYNQFLYRKKIFDNLKITNINLYNKKNF